MNRLCIIGLSTLSYTALVLAWRRLRVVGGPRLPPLQGPRPENYFFGVQRILVQAQDMATYYCQWAQEYGNVYIAPGAFGAKRVIIMDPKASAHFYAEDTTTYVSAPIARGFIERFFGRGLLWAIGEDHKRQRKALSPAFTNLAVRNLVPIFYDSAYKTKAAWDQQLDVEPEARIDIQKWMNYISLDSIGIAGLGHDFRSLLGARSPVIEAFDSFGSSSNLTFTSLLLIFLNMTFPLLGRIPSKRNKLFAKLKVATRELVDELYEGMKVEKEEGNVGKGGARSKSIVGTLIEAEGDRVTHEEVLAQSTLIFAGYETTSIALTWGLIELSRHPDIQQRLRDELAAFEAVDPTWDQLTNELPYLESYRRIALKDDILPLSKPILTNSGDIISSIVIPKSTIATSPVIAINRLPEFWGPRAGEFWPERWLQVPPKPDTNIDADEREKGTGKSNPIQGHRHLLTFSEGPRTCLGRGIALAEFKAILTVLVRNFVFELPEGPKTVIENHRSIFVRPKVVGEAGANVPLKVRRVD